MSRKNNAGPEIKDEFYNFLETYTASADDTMSQARADAADQLKVYLEALKDMKRNEKCSITVDFEHLIEYDAELADIVLDNHLYYEPYLRQAFENLIAKHEPGLLDTEDARKKEYWVGFTNLPRREKLRNLRTTYIGKLISFYGTVTRTSEVRPELYLGTFKCLQCGALRKNVLQQFKFTEPSICSNSTCLNRKDWQLLKEESIFVDWQKACVQEVSSEVPGGSLPRTIDVVLRHDLVERIRPGDKVLFSGDVIVIPDVAVFAAPGERVVAKSGGSGGGGGDAGVGFHNNKGEGAKGLGIRELNYKMAFLASDVQTSDQRTGMVNIRGDEETSGDEVLAQFTDEQVERIEQMMKNPQVYADMANSIAPGVFGHEDIKRAILLMLFGGVHKTTQEGIQLRGDINVIIVGDPSCGKSQMLKYVASFLPRAVYTSGKSSSAAGLTATVARDAESGESCIEAGALMLADNGICCIDEFDKMDVKDQVAIHEAMEQQTISLSKAGIQATLNARASILAAANPISGRYDKSKPLKANVLLPPAILSRFDLMHIMVDEPDDVYDHRVATHIVNVHRSGDAAFSVAYSREEMQRYIKYARTLKPEITEEAKKLLVESYKRLRGEDAVPGTNTSYRITVRQLEALVRLSQAVARVRCDGTVRRAYVKEAVRLLKNSIIAVDTPELDLDDVENELELELAADQLAEHIVRERPEALASQTQDDGTGEIGSNMPESMSVDGGGGAEAAMPPADGSATDAVVDTSGSGEEGAAPPAAEAPEKKKGTQVNQKKYNQIKNLLLSKLREVDEEGGEEAVIGGSSGMKQQDLIMWYFDKQLSREKWKSQDAMVDEILLVEKIVQRLVTKEQVIVVIEQPDRHEGESADAYLTRQQQDRVLAVSPNYSPE